MRACLQTVVETPAHLAAAKGVLSETDRSEVVNTVAVNPEAGMGFGSGSDKFGAPVQEPENGGARVMLLFSGADIPGSCSPSSPGTRKQISPRERKVPSAAAKQVVEDYRRPK